MSSHVSLYIFTNYHATKVKILTYTDNQTNTYLMSNIQMETNIQYKTNAQYPANGELLTAIQLTSKI